MVCPSTHLTGLFKWNFILRLCPNCPKYAHIDEETNATALSSIRFHYYSRFACCKKYVLPCEGSKGCLHCVVEETTSKVTEQRYLTLKTVGDNVLMKELYILALEELLYHRNHCLILSKTYLG